MMLVTTSVPIVELEEIVPAKVFAQALYVQMVQWKNSIFSMSYFAILC